MQTLKRGSKGDEVKVLQYLLGSLTPDGIFGISTESMVKGYQDRNQLEDDGIVGKRTWEKLAQTSKTIRRTDAGNEVYAVQLLTGVYADGIFGTNTEQAVKANQQKAGIAVDGIVGKDTWAALLTEEAAPAQPERPSEGATDIEGRLREWGFGGMILNKGLTYAVKQFQAAMGLSVDGIAGEKTKAALMGDVIKPRIAEAEMMCQCGVKHPGKGYCNGYPQGKGMAAGVLLLAERIFREVDRTHPGSTFYVSNVAHPTGSKNQLAGGYRCDKWNRERGGAAGSRHKECIAADIFGTNPEYSDKIIRDRIEQAALQLATKGGVGYGARWIVHIDTRGSKARWKY